MRKTFLLMMLAVLCTYISGCLGWFEGSAYSLRNVLDKGDSEHIAKWTMEQTDGGKIFEGLSGLTYRVVEYRNSEKKAGEAIYWCVLAVEKIENWPPDHVFPDDSDRHFTTRELVGHAFSNAAHNAYYNQVSETLLYHLRPSAEHAQWLKLWEDNVSFLAKSRQEALRNASTMPLRVENEWKMSGKGEWKRGHKPF